MLCLFLQECHWLGLVETIIYRLRQLAEGVSRNAPTEMVVIPSLWRVRQPFAKWRNLLGLRLLLYRA